MQGKLAPKPARNIADSRGHSISYLDAGTGRPLALIPGYMQSAADYIATGYVDRLAATHRVLVIDPLGHGRSDKPHDPMPYRSPGVAADVIAVLDAAGVERAVLWGYSRGAWLAAMATIEFPGRVAGLILGGTALTVTPSTEIPAWVESLSRGEWPDFFRLFPIPLSSAVMAHFEEGNDPRALAAERIGRLESAYVFDLGRVAAPSLVYCGGDDDPEDAVPTAHALGTEVRVVEGRDHFGTFEAIDQVLPIVVPFLEAATR